MNTASIAVQQFPKGATRCPKCDRYLDEAANDSHSVATVIGYIFSFLVPLAAVVAGIYLLTQKNENVHKHGACIIIIAVESCVSHIYTILNFYKIITIF